MSGLTRDGTVVPVSRGQILRRERGQGKTPCLCSANREQVLQQYSVDPYSAECADYMHVHFIPMVGGGNGRRTKNVPPW